MGLERKEAIRWTVVIGVAGYLVWVYLLEPVIDFGSETRVRSRQIDEKLR